MKAKNEVSTVIKNIRTKVATGVVLTDAEDVFMSLAVDNALASIEKIGVTDALGWNIKAQSAYQQLSKDKRNIEAYFNLVSTSDDENYRFEWIAEEIVKAMASHAAGNPETVKALYRSNNVNITVDIEHAKLYLTRAHRRGKDNRYISASEFVMQYSLIDLVEYTDYLVMVS